MKVPDKKKIFEDLCKKGRLGPSSPYDTWYLDKDGVLVEVKQRIITKEFIRHEEYRARFK